MTTLNAINSVQKQKSVSSLKKTIERRRVLRKKYLLVENFQWCITKCGVEVWEIIDRGDTEANYIFSNFVLPSSSTHVVNHYNNQQSCPQTNELAFN